MTSHAAGPAGRVKKPYRGPLLTLRHGQTSQLSYLFDRNIIRKKFMCAMFLLFISTLPVCFIKPLRARSRCNFGVVSVSPLHIGLHHTSLFMVDYFAMSALPKVFNSVHITLGASSQNNPLCNEVCPLIGILSSLSLAHFLF